MRVGVVDDLLPADAALELSELFPPHEEMDLHHTLRENKYVSAQMDRHNPVIEEALFAFQDPRIVAYLAQLIGNDDVTPDGSLFGSGISLMREGQVLNPHLDASHNLAYDRFRVLNLLYYVTPDWQEEWGGNLEVYERGPAHRGRTFHSKFNRLVIMETHDQSWHGVSPVTHAGDAVSPITTSPRLRVASARRVTSHTSADVPANVPKTRHCWRIARCGR